MKSVLKYNQLGKEFYNRKELENLIDLANSEEQYHIAKKLSDLLEKYPNVENFDIDLQSFEVEQVPFSFLGGVDFDTPDTDDIDAMGKPVAVDDIYKMITDKVIEMMKDATGKDYKKKWKASNSGINGFMIPFNFDSKKSYRGINFLMLKSRIGIFGAFENPYFLTFKQVEKHKGKVKKGSKGYEIIYFTKLYKFQGYATENKSVVEPFGTYDIKKMRAFIKKVNHLLPDSLKKRSEPFDTLPILKYYKVFNGEDIEGIDFKLENIRIGRVVPEESSENLSAELIVKNYPNPPKISHGGDKAFYMPAKDLVQTPLASDFETNNDYYRTLFHELSHSTGNKKRLDRPIGYKFGSKEYAKEELVAEFGSVFLSAQAGFVWHTNKNHVEYLKGWHNVIKIAEDDTRFLMRAASDAQKAADYILDLDANGEPKFWQEILKVLKGKTEKVSKPKAKTEKKTKKETEKPKPKAIVKPKPKAKTRKRSRKKDSGQLALFGAVSNKNMEVSTEKFKEMKVSELRDFTTKYYNQHLKGKEMTIKNHLAKVEMVSKAGRKIRYPMYKAKAAVIEHLEEIIKNSTYNNFGERKNTDSPDIIGYLNFKSKLNIDGEKHHVRISIILNEQRKTRFKSFEVGAKKDNSTRRVHLGNPTDGRIELSSHKTTKKSVNHKKTELKSNKKALNAPKEISKPSEKQVHSNIRSINYIGNNETRFFQVNGEVGKFLQAVERKPVHSVVITLDGEQGAGKTTMLYHFMDAFALAGNRSLFISGEEHQDSFLAIEKRDKFLSEEAQKNISIVSEVENVEQLYDYIDPFDIIFIDSWQKLQRMVGKIRLDEDLRKKFNGKVFVVIFQQTTTGRTKGGAEVVFDGDIIIKMVKQPSFSDNYAYFDKNRYTKIPIENIRYNIASGFTYNPKEYEENSTEEIPEEEIVVEVY